MNSSHTSSLQKKQKPNQTTEPHDANLINLHYQEKDGMDNTRITQGTSDQNKTK